MVSSNELAPSAVRKTILEEHAQLGVKLTEIKSAIKSKDSANIIKLVQDMINFFLCHIALEEKILGPVLKDIDAWGTVRVEKMVKEHAEQRQEVNNLLELIKLGQIAQIFSALEIFIDELILDMNQEEVDFLNSDVLKDDPVTVGTFSG